MSDAGRAFPVMLCRLTKKGRKCGPRFEPIETNYVFYTVTRSVGFRGVVTRLRAALCAHRIPIEGAQISINAAGGAGRTVTQPSHVSGL